MKLSSDKSLMELVKAGNHIAYTKIVNNYWEKLYKHIWIRIKDDDIAKDFVQDIFLGLWKNKETVSTDQEDSLASYLFTAAKYIIINHFSRPNIAIPDEEALILALNTPSGITADSDILIVELQELLNNEIDSLPERLQVPYRLSREQELSIREIAQKLSVSEQTVKNNISSALSTIRFKLGKYHADHTVPFILAVASIMHHK
ncbi:MAG: sigma-70 family RNA polymerase sigma factor [Pedobacter sp.]|nr:MAG: sigma-70 family RNA polymerase sigma factor [Pedobacter sp.]